MRPVVAAFGGRDEFADIQVCRWQNAAASLKKGKQAEYSSHLHHESEHQKALRLKESTEESQNGGRGKVAGKNSSVTSFVRTNKQPQAKSGSNAGRHELPTLKRSSTLAPAASKSLSTVTRGASFSKKG